MSELKGITTYASNSRPAESGYQKIRIRPE